MYLSGIFFILITFEKLPIYESLDGGTFWHISDMHLDVGYDPYGDPVDFCRPSSSNKSTDLGYFGNHSCDSPISLMKSALNASVFINSKPDFILWTGDNGPHLHDEDFSQKGLFSTIKNVTDAMRNAFPETIILPALGNHDVYPKDQMKASSNEWCSTLADLWSEFLSPYPGASATFSKGCYYRADLKLPSSTLRVIVYNSLLWYTQNTQIVDDEEDDPADHFQWLSSQLEMAREEKIKVFLVSHIPPGASEVNPIQYRHIKPKFGVRLMKILRQYGESVIAAFYAHEHSDTFRVLTSSNKEKPLFPIFLTPSITPLHMTGLGKSLPSIRLYYYDVISTKHSKHQVHLTNYEHFHFNLLEANAVYPDKTIPWKLEYKANETYPLKEGLTAASMFQVAQSLRDNVTLFATYMRYHMAGGPHDYNWNTALKRCHNYCALLHLDVEPAGALEKCLIREKCSTVQPTHFLLNTDSPVQLAEVVPDDEDGQLSVMLTLGVILGFCATLIGVSLTVNKAFCRRRRRSPLPTALKPTYDYSRM